MDIEQIEGFVFRTSSGEEFGRIRPLGGGLPQELQSTNLEALAEDDCGNYFVAIGTAIGFWDHETSEVQELASSPAEFIAGLVAPSSVTVREGQVKSIWVSPAFASLRKGSSANKP